MKYDCIHNFIIDFGPNGFKLGFRSIGKLSIHESKIYLSMCWKDNYIYNIRFSLGRSKTVVHNQGSMEPQGFGETVSGVR